MAFCSNCGTKLDNNSKFCHQCGSPAGIKGKSELNDDEDPFKTRIKQDKSYGSLNLSSLPEGHLINNRYTIISKIGQGGFGAVYRVNDNKLGTEKALKVLPEAVAADREAMEVLRSEASTMAKLNHPNIVRIFDFDDLGSVKYIDMEFVDGKNLTDIKLDSLEKRLNENEVKKYADQIARGLLYAHSNGIIHKDIKPQNILVSKENEIKIMDFGISETVRTSMSRLDNTGTSGTLVYMSPEQLTGKDVGRESDIYSFGALLYELLSGRPPFYKGDINWQKLNSEPENIAGVSSELNGVILKCLSKDYKDRFRNFDEVLNELNNKTDILDHEKDKKLKSTEAGGSGNLKPDKKIKKSGFFLTCIFLVLIFLTGAGYFFLYERPGQLLIHTDPADAKIKFLYLPEKYNDNMKLEKGKYRLEISKKGYKENFIKVDILPGNLCVEHIRLEKIINNGSLSIETDPYNAEIKIRNIKKKFYQGVKLKPGRYDIEISKPGYYSKNISVGISENHERKLKLKLEKINKKSSLFIKTDPGGAVVKILNIKSKYYDGIKLEPKEYTIKVWAKDYEDKIFKINLEPGKKLNKNVKLTAFGRLTVISDPPGADIKIFNIKEKYHDGIKLKKGSYKLSIKRKGYFSLNKTVYLKPGENKKEKVELKKGFINSTGMKFVYIKPGTFMMGSPSWESERDNDEKEHKVTLTKGYFMQTTEVTIGEFRKYLKETGSESGVDWGDDDCPIKRDSSYTLKGNRFGKSNDQPMVEVSWKGANDFVKWLSKKEGKTYSLPTEAQWEYAARAGSKGKYAGSSLSSMGWYSSNSGDSTHVVGKKKSNAWGLYDMHGNVYEWCEDWYGDYPSGDVTDPAGPSSGSSRIARGGSWNYGAGYCRSANRNRNSPGYTHDYLGFRVAASQAER